jgi:hypothetical protein
MRRTRVDQIEHDGMVRLMAERFVQQGYRVAANLPGFVSPPRVNGRIPDLVACKKRQAVITEVETASSYAAPQTLLEFRAFSAYASSAGASFHAAIPKESLEAAQRQAALWNASPAKWWLI